MAEQSLPQESIFLEALEIPLAAGRAAYLDQACGEDRQLRAEVEALLRAHHQSGDLLDLPEKCVATLDDPIRERPGAVIGRYKLLEQIGEGGFGVVFMAEQMQPVRRKVALKVIKPGMDTRQVIARFEAERQALALMDHPNIAKVLDAGTIGRPHAPREELPHAEREVYGGRPYFVMELVRGLSMTEYCDQHNLPVRERLELFVDVCQAVQHAHMKGIIHRDLKPSNVLVTLHDGKPVVKVIDFGIAKAMGQQLTDKTLFTNFAQMIGTPLYMSPEQAEMSGLDVDTRSDIYSLGVLLYELLTGTTPFDKERLKQAGFDEIRRIIREEEPPKPSTRMSTVGQAASTASEKRQSDPRKLSRLFRGELDWIVMKALEKDRNRRYETANGLARDVERYLHDEPVLACPPSALYRLRKFTRRNKARLAVGALLLVVLVLAGGGSGWIVRDQAARWAVTENKVNLALNEATELQSSGRWLEALSAVKRADGFLAGSGSDELRERVRNRQADLELALRLERIRTRLGDPNGTLESWMPLDVEYAKTFREFGFDLDVQETPDLIRRFSNRTVALELAAALTDWAAVCRPLERGARGAEQADAHDTARWKRLLTIARAIDPDPLRDRVRTAWERGESEEMRNLAASTPIVQLPVCTLLTISSGLDTKAAVPFLRQAQRLHPNDFWINLSLAGRLDAAGSQDEAIEFFRVALAIRPDSASIRARMGRIQANRKRENEAITLYEDALRLDPDDADTHLALAWLLIHDDDPNEAIDHCRRALNLRADDPIAYERLGFLLAKKGLALADPNVLREAVAAYRHVLALRPGWDRVHGGISPRFRTLAAQLNQLAWRMAVTSGPQTRDPDRPVQLAQLVVELAPDEGRYRNTLGVAYYRLGDWKEARAALEKSMEQRQGGDSFDWFFLAMAHWQLGDKEDARKRWDQAVQWMEKNAPQNEELRRLRAEAAQLLGIQEKKD
jgi:eukaryotic-like serine/threonine-protein kinase